MRIFCLSLAAESAHSWGIFPAWTLLRVKLGGRVFGFCKKFWRNAVACDLEATTPAIDVLIKEENARMSRLDPNSWMWSQALDLLERAERMQRRFFRLAGGNEHRPIWEPPLDIFETSHHLWMMFALPGMTSPQVQVNMEAGILVVSGERSLPAELRSATIRRLEIPYGRYERRVELPPGRYEFDHRELVNGVLVLSLRKL